MAHRLLPFRQYSDHEVINLFSVNLDGLPTDLKLMKPNDDGINADGVLVEIDKGNMYENDVVSVTEDSRFQGGFSSPVGQNPYPTVPLKVMPAKTAKDVIGMTLAQTLSHDENSESLLYNPVKKDELNAVLSGQACPLATRGIFTVTSEAFGYGGAGAEKAAAWQTDAVPGNALVLNTANQGCFSGMATAAQGTKVGQILATGSRDDWTAGSDTWSGHYAVVQLSLPAS